MKKSLLIMAALLSILVGCKESSISGIENEELNPATLEISPETLNIDKFKGSTATAEINSDSEVISAIVDFPYKSWLNVKVEGKLLTVTALTANTESSVREGEVIVYAGEGINTVSKKVKVVQALEDEVTPEISADKESVTIASAQNSFAVVKVTTNMPEFTATVSEEGKSWLEVSIAGNDVTIKAISANEQTSERSASVELAAGKEGNKATCSFTVTQSAKGLNIGDVISGGVLFWISEDGKTGKVVSPVRAEGADARYCIDRTTATSTDGTLGAADRENGKINVAAMKQIDATLAKFPAAKFCDELDGGEWYLPAVEELTALFKAYNGASIDGATVATPSGISAEEKAARSLFDKSILSFSNGIVLNSQAESSNGDSAFSSTESSIDKAYYVRFGKALCDKATKDGSTRTARCIKTVNF